MSISDYQRQDDSEPLPTDGVSYPAVPGGTSSAPESTQVVRAILGTRRQTGQPGEPAHGRRRCRASSSVAPSRAVHHEGADLSHGAK